MTTRYVRDPRLLAYVDVVDGAPAACIELSSSEPPLLVDDDRLLVALSILPDGCTEAEALRTWAAAPELAPIAPDLWQYCLSNSLVTCEPAPHGGYHGATRDHPFLDMSTGDDARVQDNALMRRYLVEEEYPAIYLAMEYADVIPLERAADLSERQLACDPRQELALLFHGTFGERRHRAAYHDPLYEFTQLEVIGKSIPSGGSRHPTEAFAAISHASIPTGLYHYDVRRNALGRLPGVEVDALSEMVPGVAGRLLCTGERWVVVFFVSMVRRSMWRYRDPRSFRAILVDVGHAEGHFASLAGFLGYRYAHVRGFRASAVSVNLGLDPEASPTVAVGLARRSA
jgi:SagB-type dehydrogenase family enzyme